MIEHEVFCYCGAPMKLKPSKYGHFYACTRWPECDGTHGCHPDGSPLGKPADAETRRLRQAVHERVRILVGPNKRREAAWMRANTTTGHCGSLDKAELWSVLARLGGTP